MGLKDVPFFLLYSCRLSSNDLRRLSTLGFQCFATCNFMLSGGYGRHSELSPLLFKVVWKKLQHVLLTKIGCSGVNKPLRFVSQ